MPFIELDWWTDVAWIYFYLSVLTVIDNFTGLVVWVDICDLSVCPCDSFDFLNVRTHEEGVCEIILKVWEVIEEISLALWLNRIQTVENDYG